MSMNNIRITTNEHVKALVVAHLGGWELLTGDETKPEAKDKTVAIRWIDGAYPSPRLSGYKRRMFQLEVFVADRNTNLAETACDILLAALGLGEGSEPLAVVAINSYDEPGPGEATGRNAILSQDGQGWVRIEPPEQSARFYVLTLTVDYT